MKFGTIRAISERRLVQEVDKYCKVNKLSVQDLNFLGFTNSIVETVAYVSHK